eukprot:scaffold13463_cov51-Phaeocystis_antarctica.AAC.1
MPPLQHAAPPAMPRARRALSWRPSPPPRAPLLPTPRQQRASYGPCSSGGFRCHRHSCADGARYGAHRGRPPPHPPLRSLLRSPRHPPLACERCPYRHESPAFASLDFYGADRWASSIGCLHEVWATRSRAAEAWASWTRPAAAARLARSHGPTRQAWHPRAP